MNTNPIVSGDTLHLSGVDMLDGTPVVDIKPYISTYDQPIAELSDVIGKTLIDSSNSKSGNEEVSTNEKPMEANKCGMADVNLVSQDCQSDRRVFEKVAGDISDYEVLSDSAEAVRNNITIPHASCDSESSNLTKDYHSDKVRPFNNQDNLFDRNRDNFKQLSYNASHSGTSNYSSEVGRSNSTSPHASCDPENPNLMETRPSSDEVTHLPNDRGDVGPHLNDNSVNGSKEGCIGINSDMQKDGTSHSASWISEPPIPKLIVRFTPSAANQVLKFHSAAEDENFKLKYISDAESAIKTILQADPRSTYRRTKCNDRLYFCAVDCMHVTAWFNDDENIAEVLRVKPVALASQLQQ